MSLLLAKLRLSRGFVLASFRCFAPAGKAGAEHSLTLVSLDTGSLPFLSSYPLYAGGWGFP